MRFKSVRIFIYFFFTTKRPNTYIVTALLGGYFFLFVSLLSAQTWPADLYFSTIEHKIPRSFASTFEDSSGFLWFCTFGGLCRYDGSEVILYKADIKNENSLVSSHISDITEDLDGKLWITTKGGLNSFDPSTNRFETFFARENDPAALSENWPQHITLDEKGKIWISINGEGTLAQLDPETKKIVRFPVKKGTTGYLQGKVVSKIVAAEGKVFVGTTAGLEYYDIVNQQFHFLPLRNDLGDTTYYSINALCKSRDGTICMNMPDNGLRIYDPVKNIDQVYDLKTSEGKNITQIKDINEGKDGRLWLLNWPDLKSVSPDRKILQQHNIKFIKYNPERGHEELYGDIFIDRYGQIRIGHHFFDPRRCLFEYHQVVGERNQKPLFISGLEEVNDSIIMTSTRQGLKWYHLISRSTFPLAFPTPVPIGKSTFEPNDRNWLPLKINRVFHFYHPKNNELVKLSLTQNGKTFSPSVMGFDFDSEGNIWMATWGSGLLCIPKTSWKNALGPISQFDQWLPSSPLPTIPTSNLLGLTVDSHDNVWVTASQGGLIRINARTRNLNRYDFEKGKNTVSDTYTFKVVEGTHKNIWISTNAGGLNKFDTKTKQFTIYNRQNGMLDEELFSIDVDHEGYIWMTTNSGLAYFNPSTETFFDYNENDGLMAWRTNGAISKETNRLIWGGRQGFTVAHVDSLKNRPTFASDIVLTGIRVFNPDSAALVSLRPIEWINNTLHLSYLENVLDIQFAVLDFRNPVKHRYRYALSQGGNPQWIDLGSKNQVSLNQLGPGTYYFHLQGRNSDYIWAELEAPLKLVIHPPFWKTYWAYGLYVLVFLGGLYLFYRFNLNRQLEKQEALKIKELDQFKSRFYTNITHEFRTPLTVISGVNQEMNSRSENLKIPENEKLQIKKGHSLIQRNSKNLLRLVNQLLELARVDSGAISIDYIQSDVVHYLRYLTESFASMAAEKEIKLTFQSEVEGLVMDFDEVKMQHIAYNLLSNAIKFTPRGGAVDFLVKAVEDKGVPQLQIKVKDTGIGISEEQLFFIFDRFYQTDSSTTRKGEGTGIGLALTKELVDLMNGSIHVESELNKGTVFTVLLPVKRTAKPTPIQDLERTDKLKPALRPEDKASTPNEAVSKGSDGKPERPVLLIIEDNLDVVSYLESILQKEYQIEVANDGQAGIDKALEIIPDIIITDVMMPLKDGYEVCETLKTDERSSHIPIIMLTAKATEADRLAGLKTGADAYLMKPFNKEELFIRLEKLVSLRQALQQRYSQLAGPLAKIASSKQTTPEPSLDDLFMEKIRRIIEEKIGDADLDIPYLCQKVHLSSTQLFRKMKALTGEPPIRFIRKVRLHKAKELLQTTELSVSEIAYDLGFTDPHYFSRAFSKEFGSPPSSFQ